MEVKNQNTKYESADYENFVFYGGWRDYLEGLYKDVGPEMAYETLWNLMLVGTGSNPETEKRMILGFVNGVCKPAIDAAKDRYERAQLNGQKGGRPKVLSV